jgi:hypothetical protein
MPQKDENLRKALKQAESRKMYFVFIPKGSDGKMLISKNKIPSKEIAQVKKGMGGGTPVAGKCFGPLAAMVFQVSTEPPATLGTAIEKVAHRDAGLTVISQVRVDCGADAEEHEALLMRLQLSQFFGDRANRTAAGVVSQDGSKLATAALAARPAPENEPDFRSVHGSEGLVAQLLHGLSPVPEMRDCERCGRPISSRRLGLVPAATRCWDCQTEAERASG